MERVIVEFDVSNRDNFEDVKQFFMLYDYRNALSNIDNLCRSELKYGQTPLPDHIEELLEKIRHECLIIEK